MSTPTGPQETPARPGGGPGGELPEAAVRTRNWKFPVIWVVPLVAALIVAYLLFGRLQDYGPLITIQFRDGSGIRAEQTDIEYRGVPIGQVKGIELSADRQHVLVKARLRRSAATLARQGTQFWVVRFQSGIENFAHVGEAVGTVFSGPYIEALPGSGPPGKEFVGLDSPPVIDERGALHIVLRTTHAGSLRPGVAILYRGVEVGAVQDFQFNPQATTVEIRAAIKPQYARLVRADSRFWNVSGGRVSFGLFKGLRIDVQSLRSLLTGGIAFSNPANSRAGPARDGMEFPLGNGAPQESSHHDDHRFFGSHRR